MSKDKVKDLQRRAATLLNMAKTLWMTQFAADTLELCKEVLQQPEYPEIPLEEPRS